MTYQNQFSIKKYTAILFLLLTAIFSFGQENNQVSLDYIKKDNFSASTFKIRTQDKTSITTKVVIEGFDSKVPFYVITPINELKSNNYVFLLHASGETKDDWVFPKADSNHAQNYKKIKDSLLSLGFSLIIPDLKNHGERSYEINFQPVNSIGPKSVSDIHNIFTSSTKDMRIIMDYFESKNDDEKLKFNVIGYSLGGTIATLLNSVDTRLISVVACVTPMDMVSPIIKFGWPEEYAKQLETISAKNYLQQQKAPIEFLMGNNDPFYSTTEVEDHMKNIPLSDKGLKFYDSGHYLPDAFVDDAINWISKHNN